jgi:hypothetical protein
MWIYISVALLVWLVASVVLGVFVGKVIALSNRPVDTPITAAEKTPDDERFGELMAFVLGPRPED